METPACGGHKPAHSFGVSPDGWKIKFELGNGRPFPFMTFHMQIFAHKIGLMHALPAMYK